jgi:hypothetical protein
VDSLASALPPTGELSPRGFLAFLKRPARLDDTRPLHSHRIGAARRFQLSAAKDAAQDAGCRPPIQEAQSVDVLGLEREQAAKAGRPADCIVVRRIFAVDKPQGTFKDLAGILPRQLDHMTTSAGGAVVNDGHVAIPSWDRGSSPGSKCPSCKPATWVVGRPMDSTNKPYMIWKIREAPKSRIPLGPRKGAHREGVTFKVLPLRMEATVVDKLDEAWRSRGIKNRMEFFRGALCHYLKQLGAEDAAALFADAAAA